MECRSVVRAYSATALLSLDFNHDFEEKPVTKINRTTRSYSSIFALLAAYAWKIKSHKRNLVGEKKERNVSAR